MDPMSVPAVTNRRLERGNERSPGAGAEEQGGALRGLGVADGDEAGDVVGDFHAVAATSVAVARLAPKGGAGEVAGDREASPAVTVAVAALEPESATEVDPGGCHFGNPLRLP